MSAAVESSRLTPAPPTVGSVIDYQDVSFGYPGGQGPVLERVTLSVRSGERLGILGPNGGGKSTLLKLTLGLLTGYSGRIRVLGMTPEDARRRHIIGYVPQRNEAELAFPVSGRQAVMMSVTADLPPWTRVPREASGAADEALDVVGAGSFADQPVGRLSGGQLQRVIIARALACKPAVLVLDEPTVGIDPAGQKQFAELLTRLHEKMGLTIVVVSHDIRTVAAGCDRIACLSRTLHFHDAPKGLSPAVLAEVFRHDVAAIYGDVHIDAHAAAACTDPSHHHHPHPHEPRNHTRSNA